MVGEYHFDTRIYKHLRATAPAVLGPKTHIHRQRHLDTNGARRPEASRKSVTAKGVAEASTQRSSVSVGEMRDEYDDEGVDEDAQRGWC